MVCKPTDAQFDVFYTVTMKTDPQPRIIYAERLGDGVVITFEDGKTAVYSAALLRSIFTQASELHDDESLQHGSAD
jgi:hypothetical protein